MFVISYGQGVPLPIYLKTTRPILSTHRSIKPVNLDQELLSLTTGMRIVLCQNH